jgi:hypothetical protein
MTGAISPAARTAAGGRTSTSASSRCSGPGSATRRRRGTTTGSRVRRDRDRAVLEGRPGDPLRRIHHRGDRHGGLPHAGRHAHREGGLLHQHRAARAAARQGARAGDLDKPGGRVAPEWAWAWPANRRALYNRAPARTDGAPWSERKQYIWWDPAPGRWTGYDVPDFPVDKPPDYKPPEDAEGMDAIAGDAPFIMQADGRGCCSRRPGCSTGRCRRTTSRSSRPRGGDCS